MNSSRRFCLTCSAAFLAAVSLPSHGCKVVGPAYERPSGPALPQFNVSHESNGTPAPAYSAQWWTVFNDPNLSALEELALSKNFQLAAALARFDEARARLGAVRGDQALQLTGSSNVKLAGESSVNTLPLPGNPIAYRERGDHYRVALDASYEIDFWGRVRRSVESASAQVEANQADLDMARLMLNTEIATVYFSTQSLEAELAVLSQSIELQKQQIGLSDSRAKAGLVTGIDAERGRLEVANLELQAHELGRVREQNLDTLRVLCGDLGASISLTKRPANRPLPNIPAGLPSDLLKRRPDLVSAERTLAARSAEIGVAEAAFFPTVRLTGAAGLESADLARLISRPSEFWQFGPTASIPLLNGSRNRFNLEAAKARFEGAKADYFQKTLTAFHEVDEALLGLERYQIEAADLERARTAAAEVVKLTESRQRAGLLSFFEVLDAQRALLANDRASLQLENARVLATLQLIKALGGAWNPQGFSAQ